MTRRLPPLNALRAFEAAARHLSFTKAADELNVTQAAISHQVKTLEDWLGLKLFRRMNRALRLTEEGQGYLPPVADALDGLDGATRGLLRGDAARTLTVSTMDSFAADWLVPKLKRFRALHPEIDVRITTSDKLTDFGSICLGALVYHDPAHLVADDDGRSDMSSRPRVPVANMEIGPAD